jgi:hypothetical protein
LRRRREFTTVGLHSNTLKDKNYHLTEINIADREAKWSLLKTL